MVSINYTADFGEPEIGHFVGDLVNPYGKFHPSSINMFLKFACMKNVCALPPCPAFALIVTAVWQHLIATVSFLFWC